MDGAVMTLARWHARQAITKELLAQGLKLSHIEARDITIAANRYIDEHPEVIALAAEKLPQPCCKWSIETPEKTKAVHHLEDLHGDGSHELQGLSLSKCRQ